MKIDGQGNWRRLTKGKEIKAMNMIRCGKGHFYDSDKHRGCPHCRLSVAGSNKTVSFTAPRPPEKAAPIEDFEKTTGFFTDKTGNEPVVGWLVCTAGAQCGCDFRLKAGRNFIGRAREMDVSLEGEQSISRERHAVVVYEPKQNIFLAQPGDSSALFYLNGNVVLTPVELKKNDRLQIGDAELMLIPCCDGAFAWCADEGQ